MANVCIQLNFPSPYPNSRQVDTTPVFVPAPDPTAWGEWLFGVDDASLVSQVGNHTLTVAGTPPGALVFTENTYVPFSYPNGLVATDFVDGTAQTLIFAFKRNPGVSKWIGGTLGVSPSSGSGIIQLSSNAVQFAKSVGGANQTSSIPAAEVGAIAGDILIAAIVDDGGQTYGYIHDTTTVATISGAKTLSAGRYPGAGNSTFNSSSYLSSPEYYGVKFHPSALNESAVRESMRQYLRRIQARIQSA